MRSCDKEYYIVLFKGDDSDFTGNQEIVIELDTERELEGYKAHFRVLDYSVDFTSIPSDKKLHLVFSKETTSSFPLGIVDATIELEDPNGKFRTIDNRIRIEITNSVREAYGITDPQAIKVVVTGESAEGAANPLPKYLHYLSFDDTYQDDAEEFYASIGNASRVFAGCSIVRKNSLIGGNFDYPYDDSASFVIKVSESTNRIASVGIAYIGMNLSEKFVESGRFDKMYRILPGMTESGINSFGVFAKINVIPKYEGRDPSFSSTRNLHALAVVRYVLDHFDNAREAANYVAGKYYIPEGGTESYHWMIADANGTYIVEDGSVTYNITTLTNYRVSISDDPYGTGYARREILNGSGSVKELIESVRFTNAYSEGWPWPDEFAGQVDSEGMMKHTDTVRLRNWADVHVSDLLNPATRKPLERGNGCWQTVYSTIYDISERSVSVCVQEDFSKRYTFSAFPSNLKMLNSSVDLTPAFTVYDTSGVDSISFVPRSGVIQYVANAGTSGAKLRLPTEGGVIGLGDYCDFVMILQNVFKAKNNCCSTITVNTGNNVKIEPPDTIQSFEGNVQSRKFALHITYNGGTIDFDRTKFGYIYGDIPVFEYNNEYLIRFEEIWSLTWLCKCERISRWQTYDSKISSLNSDGSQWIDTGIYADETTEIDISYQLNNDKTNKGIFGSYSNLKHFYLYSKTYYQGGFGEVGDTTQYVAGTITNAYLGDFKLKMNNQVIHEFSNRSFTTATPIALFTIRKSDGTVYAGANMFLYSAKIRKNGNTVFDAIPVRVGQTGYLFDRVGNRLLGNSGSGAFGLGADIH